MDKLIGKYAYKKRGFFSGIVGRIEKNYEGFSPYVLVYKTGSATGFHKRNEIELYEGEIDAN